jgi:hypothetical protein
MASSLLCIGLGFPNVRCYGCRGKKGISGLQWKCTRCSEYQLCSSCYMSDYHSLDHPFNCITTTDGKRWAVRVYALRWPRHAHTHVYTIHGKSPFQPYMYLRIILFFLTHLDVWLSYQRNIFLGRCHPPHMKFWMPRVYSMYYMVLQGEGSSQEWTKEGWG